MTHNQFGRFFTMTSFGESHGPAMGVVIEGCPAGVRWNSQGLLTAVRRRRPGQSPLVSGRQEPDLPEVLSGIFEDQTLGTPIALVVRNEDARSQDYKNLTHRIGHADDLWKEKFGHSDPRGGGRASGRETLTRVLAGAVAQMFCLSQVPELRVVSWAEQIGPIHLSEEDEKNELASLIYKNYWADHFSGRLPHPLKSQEVERLLLQAKEEGKSYGGVVKTCVVGTPRGLGQPVFHKLKSDLAQAMISIGATAGFELGSGFKSTLLEGSEFHHEGQKGYGGVRGGLSTGEPIEFRVAFKPTSSVQDTAKKGRHDPCIVPRAVPVIEAMTWLVLADHLLARRLDQQ